MALDIRPEHDLCITGNGCLQNLFDVPIVRV
jgi:hypothetical protein